MAGNCIKTILKKISGIPLRVFCLLLVMAQCGLLDYYMVTHIDPLWWLWVIADIVVIGAFVVAFVVSYKHLSWPSQGTPRVGGELPLGYVAWGVYSFFLAIKTGILFGPDKEIAPTLTDEGLFGTNALKATISMSAVIYLLLVLTHHDAAPRSDRQNYIRSLSYAVAYDILDTVQLLEMLFIIKTGILLSVSMHKTILGVACINLLLPTMQLLVLSRTHFAKGLYPKKLRLIHTVLYLTAINLPMLVIRVILWHVNSTNVSVFLIKNAIAIGRTLYTIFEYWMEIDDLDHPKQVTEAGESEAMEMQAARRESTTNKEDSVCKSPGGDVVNT